MKKVIVVWLWTFSLLFATESTDALEKLKKIESGATYEAFFELAKNGDIDAQTLLGEMYLDGIGVERDSQKAFYWLVRAAKQKDAQAEYLLGYMYEHGIFVSEDITKAVSWYKKAALQGDVMAQYNLALIYKDGKGSIGKDMQEAFKWLQMVEAEEDKITKVAMRM